MRSKEFPAPKVLVIGYGNSLRRDDGAGIAFAANLAARRNAVGFPTCLLLDVQLLPEMAEAIGVEGIEAVVFVDAATGTNETSIRIAEVEPHGGTSSTGHHLVPATLLVYADMLYGNRPRAWMVTVPGFDFSHGEGFSLPVKALMEDITKTESALIASIKDAIPCMN